MRPRARLVATAAGLAVGLLAACTGGRHGSATSGSAAPTSGTASTAAGGLHADAFTVLGPWTGAAQTAMQAVLARFDRDTGARGRYVAASDEARVLDTDLDAGIGPDVAILSGPAELGRYASSGRLQPLDARARTAVGTNFTDEWQSLASVGGVLFGVPLDAVDESVLWYDSATLEAAGLSTAPATWSQLVADGGPLSRAGLDAPVALAGGDGATLTGWFDNVYLRTAGPQDYDRLAAHQLPWTDRSVRYALGVLMRLWGKPSAVGATADAASRSSAGSVDAVFGGRPTSAFVYGPGSIAATLAADKDAARATARLFSFPSIDGSTPVAVTTSDYAAGLSTDPAVQPFLRFLAGPTAARLLVGTAGSGLVSPDRQVPASAYADQTAGQLAQQLLQAGDAVRPDMSELAPMPFGGTGTHSEQADLRRLLRTGTITEAQRRLERDAAATSGWPG